MKKASSRSGRKQPDEFFLGELIGEKTRVASSSCKDSQGIEGTVQDESLNSFLVETEDGVKRIPKKGSVFAFGGFEIPGDVLIIRPEDRTKKLTKTKGWKQWIARTKTARFTGL
ncbi:MAG: ribonuclease P protein subunit [Candidatus Micrarchaeota archaeon]